MDAPPTVLVEEEGSDAGNYRDVAEGRRRIVHVRGTSPSRAHAWISVFGAITVGAASTAAARPDLAIELAVIGFAPLILVAGLASRVLWRRVQWTRLVMTRRSLVARTGPLGSEVVVDGWSARTPMWTLREISWGRPLGTFRSWNLYVERHDGRRVLLATVYDEASVMFLTDLLTATYREAEPSEARHPFAVRFGPMPEDVSIDGDPEDPGSSWHVSVRCRRGSVAMDAFATAGLCVLATAPLASAGLTGWGAFEAVRGGWYGVASVAGLACVIMVAAFAVFMSALRDQFRLTVLRWRGHIRLDLGRAGVDVCTTPWNVQPLRPAASRVSAPVRVEVTPLIGDASEAVMEIIHDGRKTRLRAPIGTDEADYVAKIVQAHEAWRAR